MSRTSPLRLLVLLAAPLLLAAGYDGNLRPEVRSSQDDIMSGKVPHTELFYRGAHIFSNKFTSVDGLGEADDGPRRRNLSLAENKLSAFIRINGLDAQSCQECHGIIGFKPYGDLSMIREPGTLGGAGGISNNVMIFETPNNFDEGIVRNPPHVFGLGYVQRLSDEMTFDLLTIRDEALAEADTTQLPVRRELISKGIHFGYLTVGPTFGVDTSEVVGVSPDLVVRPFQFKGIASSLRNFIAGAMNFHFSVQPRELMERHLIPDDNPSGKVTPDTRDEIMEGDVSAVAIFLASMRPPTQDMTGRDANTVARGSQLFSAIGCAQCHVPSLRIDDPHVKIIDPRELYDREIKLLGEYVSLEDLVPKGLPQMTGQERDSRLLAPVLQYQTVAKTHDPVEGCVLDLNHPMPREGMPRLAHNEDGSIDVPLFSDLKRHRMGAALADTVDQETEMPSITVPRDEFVTRPLWGVADTGPWLHDGRATTLREAIVMHDGDGSEARAAVANFEGLSDEDCDALLEFLRSLRVRPMDRGPMPPMDGSTQFIVH